MLSRIGFVTAVVFAILVATDAAHAQSPYGFQFGYTQGYQNSFHNRLPTPPYFSVYPPVYYGKRYARPYGDSPYASFPTLQSAPDYYPTPREVPFRTRSVMNPHVEPRSHVDSYRAESEPVATTPRVGRTIEILNPYAQERMAVGK